MFVVLSLKRTPSERHSHQVTHFEFFRFFDSISEGLDFDWY